jgi:xylulokinase
VSLLGIDVGTSGCKAAVFSEAGQVLALAYEEYDYRHPRPGWAELDTAQVWQHVQDVISKAIECCSGDPVRALCVSSLGEAVVPVTAGRQVLGPSLLNFDCRGVEYLDELRDALPDEELYRINGNTLGNQYSLTKMKWIRQHEPALYRQTDWFLHWSGFVSFMLGADPHVDYSLANRTLLFDLDLGDWSGELLKLARLDQGKLPPTVPSGKVVGHLDRRIAGQLGLPSGIPIVSGGHDQCCNGIGCGVITPGCAMYGIGTYICMMPVFDRRPAPAAMIARGLNTEDHAAPGRYVSFIYNQGGALLKWFRDTFAVAERESARSEGRDIFTALLAEMPADPSRIMALPHFTATGPPDFIDDSCGVIAGVKLETSRGEVLKGLIEATTFYIRENFEALPSAGIDIADFRAVGGGSKSDAWLQICADVMGRSFVRPRINEAGVLGAAILAGVGCGVFPSLEVAVDRMVHLDRRFDPDPSRKSVYDERFAQYRRLWPLMAGFLRTLASLE